MSVKKAIFYFALMSCLFLTACAGGNYSSPYDHRDRGYDRDYNRYDNHHDHYDHDRYRERERLRDEREDLREERERIEAERRRLEYERKKKAAHKAVKPKRERCPSGFHPSEQKCTKKERKNGCKDIRLPGGLACVNR